MAAAEIVLLAALLLVAVLGRSPSVGLLLLPGLLLGVAIGVAATVLSGM